MWKRVLKPRVLSQLLCVSRENGDVNCFTSYHGTQENSFSSELTFSWACGAGDRRNGLRDVQAFEQPVDLHSVRMWNVFRNQRKGRSHSTGSGRLLWRPRPILCYRELPGLFAFPSTGVAFIWLTASLGNPGWHSCASPPAWVLMWRVGHMVRIKDFARLHCLLEGQVRLIRDWWGHQLVVPQHFAPKEPRGELYWVGIVPKDRKLSTLLKLCLQQ